MSIVSFISIAAAVLVTMIGVGVNRPGNGKVDVKVQSNLYEAFGAVTNIIFAYAGKQTLLFSHCTTMNLELRFPVLSGLDIMVLPAS